MYTCSVHTLCIAYYINSIHLCCNYSHSDYVAIWNIRIYAATKVRCYGILMCNFTPYLKLYRIIGQCVKVKIYSAVNLYCSNGTVKGLFVWCQVCGYGGHLKHIRDWHKTETGVQLGVVMSASRSQQFCSCGEHSMDSVILDLT